MRAPDIGLMAAGALVLDKDSRLTLHPSLMNSHISAVTVTLIVRGAIINRRYHTRHRCLHDFYVAFIPEGYDAIKNT